MPLVMKMAPLQERSWCVLHLVKKESVTSMRAFRAQFHVEPLSQVSIYAWYKKQKGCICKGKSLQARIWAVFVINNTYYQQAEDIEDELE
jgi:hypothetical protein